jgi:hypothetical protein
LKDLILMTTKLRSNHIERDALDSHPGARGFAARGRRLRRRARRLLRAVRRVVRQTQRIQSYVSKMAPAAVTE